MKINKLFLVFSLFLNNILLSDLLHESAFIPVAAYSKGAYNTFWKTDLCIMNADLIDHIVKLNFYSNDNSYKKEKEINIKSYESICIENIVKDYFDYEGIGLIYTLADESFAQIGVTARIYTAREDGGTYGQAVDDQIFNLSTKNSYINGIRVDGRFRTNLGISTVSSPYSVNNFLIEIYDKGKKVKEISISITAPGLAQVPIDIPVQCGFAKIVPEKSNVVYLGYISVVDNLTGDAVFIPAKDSMFE